MSFRVLRDNFREEKNPQNKMGRRVCGSEKERRLVERYSLFYERSTGRRRPPATPTQENDNFYVQNGSG